MFFLLLTATVASGFLIWQFRARTHRQALLSSQLSPEQQRFLRESVPMLSRLPPDLTQKLEGKINLFLDQVEFFGFEGVDVSDDMKLSIAAQACMLIANKDNRWYDSLRSIYIYPGAFKSKQKKRDGAVEREVEHIRIGESWNKGPVVLSWADAERGAFIDDDGHNVVLHEFAHQLDEQSGATDGAPLLDEDQSPVAWAAAFRDGFSRLQNDLAVGQTPFLDPYGATAHAEFFAVAVEMFFERPDEMKQHEPALYEQLAAYFRLNLAQK